MTGDATAVQLGLAIGAASAFSIGPNFLMLMREGLIRGRVGLLIALLSFNQIVLAVAAYWAAAAVHGIDAAVRGALAWAAVGVLLIFALQAFRAAGAARRVGEESVGEESVLACIKRALPIIWFNPLSYIECFFVPAAIIQAFDTSQAGIDFLMALMFMALLTSLGYGYGGRIIGGMTRLKEKIRLFDFASGAILSCIAAALAMNLAMN